MKLPIEEIEPYLGVVSDVSLAAVYNISRERVRQLRKERGIAKVSNDFKSPSYTRTKELVGKLEDHKELIGSIPDYKIAKIADVTVYAVKKYRQAHNIKSWCHKKFNADGLAEIEKELGTQSDRAIAEKYKVSRITVFRLRKDKHIPSIRNNRQVSI